MSASTRKTSKSRLTGLEKKGRGFGYFGDDNDRVREQEERQRREKGQRVQQMDKTTDEEGKVVFKDLPVGQYVIEVEGNMDYQQSVKTISLVNEEN